MFEMATFRDGALSFLIAFVVACVFLLVFKVVYQLLTPHHERKLIREGNVAAAVVLGGALLGYAIPLASALSHTVSLPEFAAWAALAGVIQVGVFWGVRHFALPDVSARIERGELAAAVYLFFISVVVGLVNAACMTA